MVPSGAEQLRAWRRSTVADRAIKSRGRAFQQPGVEPIISKVVAARASSAAVNA